MHLQRIRAQNFRAFGDGKTAPQLDWTLSKGLNILIGENDAGKTAVVDAIRHVLWTTSYEFVRLFEQDFHIKGDVRTQTMFIEATLADLSPDQEASVLEWLTYEPDGSRNLIVHMQARWLPPKDGKRARVDVITRTGRDGNGPEIGHAVRELVRATYLRPLRDAEAELKPARQSRLSQILAAHKSIEGQDQNDFNVKDAEKRPEKLVGLMAYAQYHLGKHPVIKGVQDDINKHYLSKFAFDGDELKSRIQIAPDLSLQPILERFELSLLPSAGIHEDERCPRGLGYNNALFMATELVLLRDGDELALLLIEEPEAHLHPQLQERVQELLEQSATSTGEGKRPVQVIMTTHSPSLAAGADVASMTLVYQGQLFPLAHEKTKLQKNDYEFLRRFLDATKANLFFARGVAVVEGPAEALLLPALAKACGKSFSKHGLAVVNVGGIGLYHYARIFQRTDGKVVPIPVVCLTDRDVVPDVATYVSPPKNGKPRFEKDFKPEALAAHVKSKVDRAAGDRTIVCVSDRWTFEFDLARYGCGELMFTAIQLAVKAQAADERLTEEQEVLATAAAHDAWVQLKCEGLSEDELAARVYEPLATKKGSKAVAAQYAGYLLATEKYGTGEELFAKLPPYLQRALNWLTKTPGGA
ncbi:AAA family ATPase [Roseateles sp. DAIF2]|uniref:ATP-dependent nuclease n=1 Tax=Roseateles sp. DAIF2 TaxID=2714952 RepID=UPI0018A28949|nr:AAA family ATPase [Roseateles sp. DAIF2]QPF72688.1 AAA family ATPase [Roseateles sp. DAIF2]